MTPGRRLVLAPRIAMLPTILDCTGIHVGFFGNCERRQRLAELIASKTGA